MKFCEGSLRGKTQRDTRPMFAAPDDEIHNFFSHFTEWVAFICRQANVTQLTENNDGLFKSQSSNTMSANATVNFPLNLFRRSNEKQRDWRWTNSGRRMNKQIESEPEPQVQFALFTLGHNYDDNKQKVVDGEGRGDGGNLEGWNCSRAEVAEIPAFRIWNAVSLYISCLCFVFFVFYSS